MHTAFLFPGQGSQYIGMQNAAGGLDSSTLQEADDTLGFPLSTLMQDGPDTTLARTENTQPAILTASVALFRKLQHIPPIAACGHSLGEYSALVAANALDFADALRLVRLRGQAMQRAVPPGVGAMAAIMGIEPGDIAGLCEEAAQNPAGETEVLSPSALNGPAQIVVAGHTTAIDRLVTLVENKGGACKKLVVSAPFHCALMQPAAEELKTALESVEIRMPRFPVIHNATATVATTPDEIRARLIEQVVAPVRFEACIRAIQALGAVRAIEVGAGKTLAGLVKRIDRNLKVISLDSPGSWGAL